MNGIKNLSIHRNPDFTVTISFLLDNDTEDITNFVYSYYGSTSPQGNWILLVTCEDLECTTTVPNPYKTDIEYYFKVKATDTKTLKEYESEVIRLQYAQNSKIQVYLDYTNNVALKFIGNPPFLFFKKKRIGDRCECWDIIRKVSKNPKCPRCGGTGMISGYETPISFLVGYMSQMPSESENPAVEGIKNVEGAITIWTMNTFDIHPGDIIIGENSKRYNILGKQVLGKTSKLILTLQEIPQGDPSYSINLMDVIKNV